MATIEQLTAQRDKIAAQILALDARDDRALIARRQREITVINAQLAAAVRALPDTESGYLAGLRFAGELSGDRGTASKQRQDGVAGVLAAGTFIKQRGEAWALRQSATNSPAWVSALDSYNKGRKYDARFSPIFEKLRGYYKQGQAQPGRLTHKTALDAYKQWAIDAAPSGFDKAIDTVVKAAVAAGLVYGVYTIGSAVMSASSGPGSVAAGTTPGAAAASTTAPVSSAAAVSGGATVSGGITAAGVAETVGAAVSTGAGIVTSAAALKNAVDPAKPSAPVVAGATANEANPVPALIGLVAVLGALVFM